MNYEELKNKAEVLRTTRLARLHKGYHFARSLGFSSHEGTLLASLTQEAVKQLAKERDSQ